MELPVMLLTILEEEVGHMSLVLIGQVRAL